MRKKLLPDDVISYIFSKLILKDLVKTSTLSKQWHDEWGLRVDLNFDLHNIFDFITIQELQESLPLFQSEFATRMDQFMLHYQGATIHSIRVNFPLGDEHSDTIDRLISQGISKGAKRIELLFSYETNDIGHNLEIQPYKISFTLLSHTDSMTHLHLQNCLIVEPIDFSGFKNLRTLVLHLVVVKQDLIQGLFSNCIHLLDFTLNACKLKSDLKIISPTLFHLNIVHRQRKRNIDIIASNLSSIVYTYNHKFATHTMNVKAHMLSKFSYKGSKISKRVGFSGMKNVTTIVLEGLNECLEDHVIPLLFSECLQLEDVTFKNCRLIDDLSIISAKLRHLNIIDCGFGRFAPYRIDIDASNLSSFEYSCHTTKIISIKAPRLLKVFWNAAKRKENPCPFGPIARLHHIQNLSMIISHSQIMALSTILIRFQNLRQLEFCIEGAYDPDMDYFWILNIAMASEHLQKLSLTIRNSPQNNSHMAGFKRQRREYAEFFHNGLKHVELRGCVCTINTIELASHLLRSANSLKQITFSSHDKEYIGAGSWNEDSNSCCFDKSLIHEMLNDEVNGQCQLIIM